MKTLCKLSKEDRKIIMKFDKNPKYKCKKCKRVASKKAMLCKPKKID